MKNTLKICAVLSFIILCGFNPAFVQEPEKEDSLSMYKGEVKVLTVDNPTRVVVNNPAVADVASVDKKELVIAGRGQGSTSLIWWDAHGQHLIQLVVFPEDMGSVKNSVDNILKEMNIATVSARAINSEGKVLLLGTVKTPQELERINVALASNKAKLINVIQVKEEEAVIGIDVQVLELDRDATSTLGFSWPGSIDITEVGSPALNTAAGTTWGQLFRVLNVSRDAFTLTLDALAQEGKARILSQPQLSCQSGKEAELLVGGEKPILTTTVAATTGATGTSVEYKEFGIKLKIKPSVTEDKKIKLALNVEVSEVQTPEILGSANSPTARAYPLTKRNASTELFLNDGQTMAIGGLKKQKSDEDIRKTPILGDVPLLGLAFRKKTTRIGGGEGERGDVNLFITLTPTILKEAPPKAEAKSQVEPAADEKPPVKSKAKVAKAPASAAKEQTSGFTRRSYTRKSPAPVDEYVRRVSYLVRRNFSYPWAAKQAGIEGSVKLALRVDKTGQLLDVEVRDSSGYAVLDENAVNIIKKVAPYPPFSPQMEQKELWIDLPIVYKNK
ncbi:MAG: TonB family protein [Candidatus Omnitrophica bacterium]|nr:TonB family protein [Candidatus Omnitrophota bacterium]MDD5552534.1 TonB family protein [Candidatus Omnitrophota bacterium]